MHVFSRGWEALVYKEILFARASTSELEHITTSLNWAGVGKQEAEADPLMYDGVAGSGLETPLIRIGEEQGRAFALHCKLHLVLSFPEPTLQRYKPLKWKSHGELSSESKKVQNSVEWDA